jgi:hypothetical protein
MDWPEGVAARRRVLVGALVRCLAKSKVCEVVDATTVESVLDAAAGELWREGEFRLEYVWKILCQQPGLSAREVAPPLAAFKSFEEQLGGVEVRLPAALSAVPRAELTRLRDELIYTREEFATALAVDLKKARDAEAANVASQAGAKTARKDVPSPVPVAKSALPGQVDPVKRRRRQAILAAVLGVGAVASVAVALSLTVFDKPSVVPLEDVASYVRLSDGKTQGGSLSARIADPRWETLSMDDQHKAVESAFETLHRRGIAALTLTDGTGKQRALAIDHEGHRSIIVMPR